MVIALAAPDLLEGSPNRIGDDFKLVLHTAFKSENEAIGLELIEALEKLSKGRFTHIPKKQRWTEDFFLSQLKEELPKKIWICGPPIVQEIFDHAVEKMPLTDEQRK